MEGGSVYRLENAVQYRSPVCSQVGPSVVFGPGLREVVETRDRQSTVSWCYSEICEI